MLSSGAPIFQLTIPRDYSLGNLKREIVKALKTQLMACFTVPKPNSPALAFRTSVGESPITTYCSLSGYTPRLYAYKGEELKTSVEEIKGQVCVLRISDLSAYYCDLRGNISTTLINTEEEIEWNEAFCEAKEVIIVAVKHYFVCQVFASEPVFHLKLRLANYLKASVDTLAFWHNSEALDNDRIWDFYAFQNRVRLALLLPTDKVGIACNKTSDRVIFPEHDHSSASPVLNKVKLLKPDWRPTHIQHTPILHSLSKQYFIASPDSTFISLQIGKNWYCAVVPAPDCTVRTAKECIGRQHGLPSDLLAIAVNTKLKLDKTVGDYGVEDGDTLIVMPKKAAQKLDITFIGKRMRKVKLSFLRSDFISDVKSTLLQHRPFLSQKILLLRGKDVLSDAQTLEECEITKNDGIYVLDVKRYQFPDISIELGICVYISAQFPQDETENWYSFHMDFATKQYQKQSKTSRNQRFLQGLKQSPYYLTLLTAGNVLFLRVHEEAKVATIKTHLQVKLRINGFKLMRGDEELDDKKTLIEQKVGFNDTLTLLNPSDFCISVATPAGQCSRIVLNPQIKVEAVMKALEQLPGTGRFAEYLIYTKRLTDEDRVLPRAFDRLLAWIQVGKGVELELRTGLGVEMRVEAGVGDIVGEIRRELEGKIAGRPFQLYIQGNSLEDSSTIGSYCLR